MAELATQTQHEAELIAERQRQLQEQAADLLRGDRVTSERPSAERTANRAGSADEVGEAIARANYTASGLGAFTLPLMASRAAGLTPESIASIEAATSAATRAAGEARPQTG